MIGSEFGVNNMKDHGSIMHCLNGSGCRWCNDVLCIFLTHFGLLPIEHCLNATAYLSIVSDNVHPFMTAVDHLLMATSSRIMGHVTKHI